MDQAAPKRGLIGLLTGALLGATLVGVAGGAALWAYWLNRCGPRGACDDPERVARWASGYALLMGTHGAAIGGVVGLLAGLSAPRGDDRRRGPWLAGLAGGAGALVLGAAASHSLWVERGTAAVAILAVPLHATVGVVITMAMRRRR